MRAAKLIVYLCALVLIILGIYGFIYADDNFSGMVWTIFGIIFLILGYVRVK